MSLRVLIADDEPLARSRIAELLSEAGDVELVGEARNGLEAVELVRTQQPDLIFLDVQMPGLNGFGVLRALDQTQLPAVIFVTAFDRHAVEAFEVHAVDYLLKPYQPDRFQRALQRAREQWAGGPAALSARLLRLLEAEKPAEPSLSRFSIKGAGKTYFVSVKDVDWIEAAGNYLILHVGKESHLVRDTLAGVEGKLPAKLFARVNRSALVNLERVKQIEPSGGETHVLTLRDGTDLPVTRSVRELEELLKFG